MLKKIWNGWRTASQRLYDKFGSKLQGKYDQIAGWELDEDLKKTLDALAGLLSPAMVAKFLRALKDVYEDLDNTKLGEILKSIKEVL